MKILPKGKRKRLFCISCSPHPCPSRLRSHFILSVWLKASEIQRWQAGKDDCRFARACEVAREVQFKTDLEHHGAAIVSARKYCETKFVTREGQATKTFLSCSSQHPQSPHNHLLYFRFPSKGDFPSQLKRFLVPMLSMPPYLPNFPHSRGSKEPLINIRTL